MSVYLASDQTRALRTWKSQALKSPGWKEWCEEHQAGRRKFLGILKRADFFNGNTLSREEINDLFYYAQWGQGGRNSLRTSQSPYKVSEALRFLFNEKKPLPDRFEKFYRLKGLGIWTASQILSKWNPRKYAFVASSTDRNTFMRKLIFDRLSPESLESAKEDALLTFGISEEDYFIGTIEYLQLSMILAEVKQLLGLKYYWEIQNILWFAWERRHKLPTPAKKGKTPGHGIGYLLSTEAIGASDAAGMKIVQRFEKARGWAPDPKPSTRPVGYDILSRSKHGAVRYIEVKTRFGPHRVALTENQHRVARDLGKDYFVYVVTNKNKICIIRNPVAKCEIVPIRTYEYKLEDWVKKGKMAKVK
jgi:hypothetical protein